MSLTAPKAARVALHPFLLLIVSVLTRLPPLTWRSFDGDESVTVFFSRLPWHHLFTHLADLTTDRHPLLIYVLVKFWRGLVGESDLALRLMPALFGLLTVALVYRIGVEMIGRKQGFLAALLFALNPLVIYQHQDVRMYAPALFLMALAVWLSLRVHTVAYPRRALWFLSIAVAAVAAVYLHLLATTVLPVIALLLWRHVRRTWPLAETAVLVAIALALSPYLWRIVATGHEGGGTLDGAAVWRTLLGSAKTVLDHRNLLTFPWNELVLTLLLLLIGVLALWRQPRQAWLPAFWLLTALLMIGTVMIRIEFFPYKSFVFAIVPLSLLSVMALFGRNPLTILLPLAAFVVLFVGGQWQLWRQGSVHEDFRSAALFVNQLAAERDVVIVHRSWYQNAVGRYLNRPMLAPPFNPLRDQADVAAALLPLPEAEVLWLVQAGLDASGSGLEGYEGDPLRLVQGWLESRFPLVTEAYPPGVSVRAYALAYRLPALPEHATPLTHSFGGVALVGYHLARDHFPTRDGVLHPPSTWIPLTLYWSVQAPLSAGITPLITLEDDQGGVWGGPLTRENDVRRFHPPEAWVPGEVVRQDVDLVVNPQIAPGQYKLVVRVLDDQSGAPLRHDGGQEWLILQQVQLERAGWQARFP